MENMNIMETSFENLTYPQLAKIKKAVDMAYEKVKATATKAIKVVKKTDRAYTLIHGDNKYHLTYVGVSKTIVKNTVIVDGKERHGDVVYQNPWVHDSIYSIRCRIAAGEF